MTAPVGETPRSRNINVWKDAEVWVSDNDDATVAPDGTFSEDWAFIGLLNEGSEIGSEKDEDRNDINSFGGKKQMTDVRFRKDVRTFDGIEDNEVTHQILHPGSEWVEDGVSVLATPYRNAEKVIAFKTVNSFGDVLIDISRRKAEIYASGVAKSDDGAEVTSYSADVVEDDFKQLYDRLRIRSTGVAVNDDVAPIRIEGVTESGPVEGDEG